MFFRKKSSFDENDLESIILACIDENQQAQKSLVKMFYGYSKSIAMRYSSSIEEAEEIINDSFLKVFNNLIKYDHTLSFKAWLRTIVVNTSIDYFRKSKKALHQVELANIDIEFIDIDIISKISADEILQLIQQLTPAYRMVFSLYVIEGYNHREIAELLGIKEGTSKSNLQDARKKLQQMIKQTYPYLHSIYSFNKNKINEQ